MWLVTCNLSIFQGIHQSEKTIRVFEHKLWHVVYFWLCDSACSFTVAFYSLACDFCVFLNPGMRSEIRKSRHSSDYTRHTLYVAASFVAGKVATTGNLRPAENIPLFVYNQITSHSPSSESNGTLAKSCLCVVCLPVAWF